MDNTNNAAAPDDFLNPETHGSTFPASFDTLEIADEDMALATELASFDPVNDTASPVQWIGGTQKAAPADLKVGMLNPDERGPIEAQLRGLSQDQRSARETQLVQKALYDNSLRLRILAGPGEGATEIQKQRFLLAKDQHDLEGEAWRIHGELAEVLLWEPVFTETGEKDIDPATQQQKIRSVQAIEGDKRTAMQNRLSEISRQIDLLQGIEGDRRERKAIKADIARIKERREAADVEQQAHTKADEILRQERIDARAQSYANLKRGNQ